MTQRGILIPTERRLQVGAVVEERFIVRSFLASGGQAELYCAEDKSSGEEIALKVLRAPVSRNGQAVARLRREGQVLSQLNQPTVVSFRKIGFLEDGTLYLAMELLRGETLRRRIDRGVLSVGSLIPLVTGVCVGLEAAHQAGVVHRDLKPSNIHLCPAIAGEQVKLLDFGLSKLSGAGKLTQTGQVLGTPRYMSPEQLSAEEDVDFRTDLYSLAVILYEALAGCPPFQGGAAALLVAILKGQALPLRTHVPGLSTEVEAVIHRAMSVDREARYPSAFALAEAFVEASEVADSTRGTGGDLVTRGMGARPWGFQPAASKGRPIGGAETRGDEPGREHTFSALGWPRASDAVECSTQGQGAEISSLGMRAEERDGRISPAVERQDAVEKQEIRVSGALAVSGSLCSHAAEDTEVPFRGGELPSSEGRSLLTTLALGLLLGAISASAWLLFRS